RSRGTWGWRCASAPSWDDEGCALSRRDRFGARWGTRMLADHRGRAADPGGCVAGWDAGDGTDLYRSGRVRREVRADGGGPAGAGPVGGGGRLAGAGPFGAE